MSIRILKPHLVNQIAAGEVVERPASVLKELVENAIDAGATRIDVNFREGGRAFLSVEDNGYGMNREDLHLCIQRHATSKIRDENLFAITTFGFRGEALPSIASIARVRIDTRCQEDDTGWSLSVEGGRMEEPVPTHKQKGTRIEVSDLFYATPARLKFLKNTATEQRIASLPFINLPLPIQILLFAFKMKKTSTLFLVILLMNVSLTFLEVIFSTTISL
jgi:DNA mismatch repair protein MutL